MKVDLVSRLWGGLPLCLVLLAACSEPSVSPPGLRDTLLVGCDETVSGVDGPPDTYSTVLGVVALPWDLSGGTQLGVEPDPAGGYFAKAGVDIRSDEPVVILVPDRLREEMAVGWGFSEATTWEATFEPCGDGEEWRAYSGGFWVRNPLCATLLVSLSAQRNKEITLGIGVSC